jgi:hypothetical protein
MLLGDRPASIVVIARNDSVAGCQADGLSVVM